MKPAPSALGLDYEDNSDSEGSAGAASPRGGELVPTEELAEEMGDVAMKMRQKRQRAEEDDEGFAGLLGKAAAMSRGSQVSVEEGDPKDKLRQKDKDKSPGVVKEELGKKIKLNLGVKRLGGYLQKAIEGKGSSHEEAQE